MSMTFEEALEYIYKVVKCREQDKAKCNGCESCSYNFKVGWTYKAEKAIAQYYEERHRQSEQTPAQSEIIRCKDCKHKGTKNCVANAWTTIFGFGVKDDFYCGLAERRTDGGTGN